MSKHLIVAKRAAKQAGDMLMKRQANFKRASINFKKNNESVTSYDKAAERIIFSNIKKVFPEYGILSEESGHNKKRSDYLWIIDPLDGTSNFTMMNPLYGVSIALAKRHEVILGVLYFPALKRMVWAERGKKAFLNGKRIYVSGVTSFTRANHFLCNGRTKEDIRHTMEAYKKFLPKKMRLRHLGSAALELSMLAMGSIETYMSIGEVHEWDLAAGQLIIKEAGGTITDFKGNDWNLKSKNLAASNSLLHKKLLAFIK
jgi:myo-inositol-1(or 4)-monophosphatase